jgi:hypothetical protein
MSGDLSGARRLGGRLKDDGILDPTGIVVNALMVAGIPAIPFETVDSLVIVMWVRTNIEVPGLYTLTLSTDWVPEDGFTDGTVYDATGQVVTALRAAGRQAFVYWGTDTASEHQNVILTDIINIAVSPGWPSS